MQPAEAQAYLNGLENGTIEIPTDASTLEVEAATKLKALNKKFSELQIRREEISLEINITTGKMTAYVEMLLMAETARRTPQNESHS